jgi:DNA-nicking Smr family endonuclease
MNSNAHPRKRPLTAEEAELWAFAMREAKALRRQRERHEAAAIRVHGNAALPQAEVAPEVSAKSAATKKSAAPAPPPTATHRPPDPAKSPPPLARYNERERRKLARDTDLIDARLDLHGMRQREAHVALKRFLLACLSRGDRHVLVITGKGAPAESGISASHYSAQERGVLRRLVPQWMAESDLRGLVVSYTAASARHGGDGALYVRLRKAPVTG